MPKQFLFITLFLLFAVPVFAQTTTATLQGTVSDANGAVLAGASVRVEGPRVDRTITADENGFYQIVQLPAGTYTVTATQSGFANKVTEGVTLALDRTVILDILLAVAGVSDTVTVEAGAALIDPQEVSTRQVVDSQEIDNIPLNGRNYLDLIQLTPGVVVNSTARSDLTDRDTRGSIMGERAGNAAFLVNGFDNNDDFRGGVFQNFTQDSIQEFEVIAAGYKAEFGRGSGGVVNVVTKSGANAFHGSGFMYLRNDALDASNVAGADAPELARYNYGFTLGGPIRQDKSWFFGSLEQFQEDREAIFPTNIPPFLEAAEDFSQQPQSRRLLAFTRYDHRLNEKNDLHVQLSFTRAKAENELATATSLPSSSRNNLTRTFLGTISLTTMFNPHVVMESSFNARAQNFDQNRNTTLGEGFSIVFLDRPGAGFDFGPPAGSVQTLHQRYFGFREQLSWYSGAHAAKFGLEYVHTIANGENGQAFTRVIATTQASFQTFGINSFQIPQGTGFINPGDNLTRVKNDGISLFAQDDWRIHKKLMLSGGLRYDHDSKFGTHNFAPRLGLNFSPDSKTAIRASWGLFYDRYRLGIVQAVPEFGGFNGRTLVEFNFPRLANDVLLRQVGTIGRLALAGGGANFLNARYGIPPGSLVTVSNIQALTGLTPAQFLADLNAFLPTLGPALPADFSPSTGFLRQDLGAAFQDRIRVDRPFHTPYNASFTLGVERQLFSDLAVGASYVHRSIHSILGLRITNLAFTARIPGGVRTTDGGPLLRTYGPFYSATYDALVLTLEKRFSRRFQLQANYTRAKSIDNLLNSNLGLGVNAQGGGAVPTDNLDLNFDRGNSDFAVPHSFVTSGILDLPFGFIFSGVVRATSGAYFSAAGGLFDYDGDGIQSARPVGTTRNQFRGPKTFNLDTRVEKRFRFGERFAASALIEFFNLTNERNPRLIDNSWVSGAPGPTFGDTRVPLPGREIQIGFRLTF
jgi:outer membrane receptor for ferrienterochelin and colicin